MSTKLIIAGSPSWRKEADRTSEPQPVGKSGDFINRVRASNQPRSPKLGAEASPSSVRPPPGLDQSGQPAGGQGSDAAPGNAQGFHPKAGASEAEEAVIAAPSDVLSKGSRNQRSIEPQVPTVAAQKLPKAGPKLPAKPLNRMMRFPTKQSARKHTGGSLGMFAGPRPAARPLPAVNPVKCTPSSTPQGEQPKGGDQSVHPTPSQARGNARSPVTRIVSPPLVLSPFHEDSCESPRELPGEKSKLPPGRWGKDALESPPLQVVNPSSAHINQCCIVI
jgi:hypothetical protein